jgi:hypothetical protein
MREIFHDRDDGRFNTGVALRGLDTLGREPVQRGSADTTVNPPAANASKRRVQFTAADQVPHRRHRDTQLAGSRADRKRRGRPNSLPKRQRRKVHACAE